MSEGQSTQRYRRASGSSLISAIATALSNIKDDDGLNDDELGRMLGKSGKDQGKAYRTGFTEMPVTSFLRGCENWDGRFANPALALIGMKLIPLDTTQISDRSAASSLTKLLLEMSIALEDGKIDDSELQHMHRDLEEAGKCIDSMRQRLSLRAA